MSTTINLQVAALEDDVREIQSGLTEYDVTLSLQNDAADYAAFRWQADIPQGATISAASLQVYVPNATYDEAVTDVYGFDQDTVAAFDGMSTSYGISSVSKTSATIAWDSAAMSTGWKTVGDVYAIVQEIVDRAGWAANNYLGLMIKADTGCDLRIGLYKNDSSRGAKLDITYTAVTGVPKQAMYYARMRS